MNFDVVQASEYMAPALFLARSVPSLIVRVSAPASLILECDGLPLGTDNAWAAQLERRALRQARTIVSPSRFMERSLPRPGLAGRPDGHHCSQPRRRGRLVGASAGSRNGADGPRRRADGPSQGARCPRRGGRDALAGCP